MGVAMITWDGGSNRQPFESLCRGLIDREIGVHVLTHAVHRELYEALGAEVHQMPVGDKGPGSRPSAEGELERVMDIWLSPEVADAVVSMFSAVRFDIAVVDVSLVTAFAACEAVGPAFVALHHTLPGAVWSGPRRERFEALVEPVNEVRRTLGLDAVGEFAEIMSAAAAHIVPTAAVLDDPAPWPLPLHYVGPLQPDAIDDGSVPELPPRFVLVSFSTTWQRQISVLQETIDALSSLDRPVVVTTGPSVDPSELEPAGNSIVTAQLPHRRILDRVDVVVTHAGHGTVLSALTAGVPLVCVPMGRDQHDVSRRVVEVGAGVRIEPTEIAHGLEAAVRHVLDTRRFTDTAAAVARSISGHGGVAEALDIIERCSQRR